MSVSNSTRPFGFGLASIAMCALFACTTPPDTAASEQAVGNPAITTGQGTYPAGQGVDVSWTGSPGDPGDWISIAPAGSPADNFLQWSFTGGNVAGSHSFAGLTDDGNYEARLYQSGTYTILASHTFAIGAGGTGTAIVTTDKAIYGASQPVTISWSGTPGNVDDWIAIVTFIRMVKPAVLRRSPESSPETTKRVRTKLERTP